MARVRFRAMERPVLGISTLFLISFFPPVVGGAERQASLLARVLNQHGACVSVLTRSSSWGEREQTVEGVQVHRRGIPVGGKAGSIFAAASWALFVAFRGRRFQLFHAHQPHSAMWVALLGRIAWRRAVVVKMPGERGLLHTLRSRLKRFVINRFVDTVVVVNQDHRRLLVEAGISAPVRCIPNGVDLGRFRRAADERGSVDQDSVVFVGRLIRSKGVDTLLQSWETVEERSRPAPKLVIVGDGPEKQNLEDQANELDLRTVDFVGAVEDVLPYLQRAIIYAAPSKSEGLSNALLEAMSLGLPIVASRISGVRDLLRHRENALLFEPDSHAGLSKAIVRLLEDPRLRERLGDSARRTVAEDYDIDDVARRYEELYRSLVRG